MMAVIVSGVHYVAILVLAATLVLEWVQLKGLLNGGLRSDLDSESIQRLVRIDAVYGMSAGMILLTGVLRVFVTDKGWLYYSANSLFWSKLGLFLIIGLISIYPTLRFLAWRKASQWPERGEVQRLQYCVTGELGALVLLPFMASAMARGLG